MREPIKGNLREWVLNRDGHRCRYCGSTSGPFHLDHVYPVSKGGETTMENLVTSCAKCNLQKHNSVGMWPKPIGYFDRTPSIATKHAIVHGVSAMIASLGVILLLLTREPVFLILGVFGGGANLVNYLYLRDHLGLTHEN